ncbi:MAG: 30S ribosomal protein S20 [Candidatus Dormibacteria bacterium]
MVAVATATGQLQDQVQLGRGPPQAQHHVYSKWSTRRLGILRRRGGDWARPSSPGAVIEVEEKLANSSSARKRIRSAERKHEQNRGVRSAVRTAVVKARRAVVGTEPADADALVRLASSALDKAAEHGVLHARNASRRKSRLMKLAAKMTAAESSEPVVVAAKKRPVTARGTKPKAGTAAKKTGTGGKTKPVTKTERTAARTRRTAGSTGSERS